MQQLLERQHSVIMRLYDDTPATLPMSFECVAESKTMTYRPPTKEPVVKFKVLAECPDGEDSDVWRCRFPKGMATVTVEKLISTVLGDGYLVRNSTPFASSVFLDDTGSGLWNWMPRLRAGSDAPKQQKKKNNARGGGRRRVKRGTRQKQTVRTEKQVQKATIRALASRSSGAVVRQLIKTTASNEGYDSVTMASKLAVEQVQQFLISPGAVEPLRYASPFSTAATAVVRPWTAYPAGWLTTSFDGDLQQLPADTYFAAFFRDPYRAYVAYDANSSTANDQYDFVFVDETSGGWGYEATIPAGVTMNFKPVAALWNSSGSTGQYKPHGPYYYPGRWDDQYMLWIDKGSKLKLNITEASDSGSFVFELHSFTTKYNPTVASVIVTPGVGGDGTATYNITESAYYSVSVTESIPSAKFSANIVNDTGISHYGHHFLPGFDDNVYSVQALRLSALAIMFSPRASPLNLQGEIFAAQVPASAPWITYTDANTIDSAQGRGRKLAKQGIYAWLRPTQPSDWNFVETMKFTSTNEIADGYFNLKGHSEYLALLATCTDTQGRDNRVTAWWGGEYRTKDSWRTLGVPTVSSQAFDEALEAMKFAPQFYENPSHLAKIWSVVKSTTKAVLNGIKRYGPQIVSAATAFSNSME